MLEYPIGHPIYESALEIHDLRVSPSGDRVAFFEGGDEGSRIVVVDRSGKKRIESRPFVDWWFLAWSPDGREVWFDASERQVTSALFGLDLEGHERPIAATPGFTEIHDLAPDGRALMTFVSNRRPTYCLPPGGAGEIDCAWLQATVPSDLSPDGRALLLRDIEDEFDSFLRGTDGSAAIKIGSGRSMTLSPDGRSALVARRTGLLVVPTGIGEARTLAAGKFSRVDWAEWHPDDRRVLVSAAEPGRRLRIYSLETAGGDPQPVGPEGLTMQPNARSISPDGSALVAFDPEGRAVLLNLDGAGPRPIPGFESGDRIIRWTSDGRGLFVVASGRIPAPIFQVDLRTGQRTLWKELAPRGRAGFTSQPWVIMTPDGRS
jgi:Tol biopolymer transport system component